MITGWEKRDDYWTNTSSPGFDHDRQSGGCLETRRRGSSGLIVSKKNGMRLLWHRASRLLRQDSATDTGPVMRECSHLRVSGDSASSVQEVRESETGEASMAGKQSLLYEAVFLLCGTEVSSHDYQRCGKRIETGLAHGQDIGERVYAGAVAAESGGNAQGNRDRRNISAERAYLPNSGQRSGKKKTDLVWWRGSLRGEP